MSNKKKIAGIILFVLIGLAIFSFAATPDEERKQNGTTPEQGEQEPSGNENEIPGEEENETPSEEEGENNPSEEAPVNGQGESQTDNTVAVENAVKRAENTLTLKDKNTAQDLVDGLGDADLKEEFNDRLDQVEEKISIEINDLREAKTRADEQAKTLVSKDQDLVNAKTDLGKSLEDANKILNDYVNVSQKDLNAKAEELNQLVDQTIELIKQKETDATAAVEALEKEVYEASSIENITNARTEEPNVTELVNNLLAGTVKEDLLSRLEKLAKILNDNEKPDVNGISNGTHTRQNVVITATDDNELVATLNGNPYELGTAIEAEGNYTLVVRDSAFNETVITFTIDKTKPSVTGVEDGAYYRKDVTPVIEDANLQNVVVKYNGEKLTSYKLGDTLTKEGIYQIRVTDKAGNKFDYITFTIDKTLPLLVVDGKTIEPTDETLYFANDILVTVDDENFASFTTNGHDRTDNVLADGWKAVESGYTFVLTDKAGNETTYKVVVDKTNPVFTGIMNGHQYKEVTLGLTEKNIKTVEIYNRDLKKYYDFEEGMKLTEDGTYTAYAVDKAGNETGIVYFEVDGIAPIVTLNYSTKDWTNHNVVVTLTANEDVTIKNAGTWSPDNGYHREYKKSYPANQTQTVTVVDRAGNDTVVKVEIANIDKDAPVPNIETVVNGISTTENPQINGTDVNPFTVTVKVDGEVKKVRESLPSADGTYTIRFGIGWLPDGNYEVTMTDSLGNTETETFKLIRLNLTASGVGSNLINDAGTDISNFNSFAIKFNKDLTFTHYSKTEGFSIAMEYSLDGKEYVRANKELTNGSFWDTLNGENGKFTTDIFGGNYKSTYTVKANSPIYWSGTKINLKWPEILKAIKDTAGTENKVYVRTVFTVIQPEYTKSFTLEEIVYSNGGKEVSHRGLPQI